MDYAMQELCERVSKLEEKMRAVEGARKMPSNPKCHRPSGQECLVGHISADGNLEPGCPRCKDCRQFIRYNRMDEDCPCR